MQIPREAIEARLAGRLGFKRQSPLRFQTAFDLKSSAGRDWRALLNFTVRSVDEGGLFSRDPLCADLEDLLLSALLATQPHNYAGELHDGLAPVPYYALRAEREMRERMVLPLTIARLADVAGVSERTLHDGFRRFRTTTPMGRLTALRLAAARRRLLDAKPRLSGSILVDEAHGMDSSVF